MEAVLAGLTVFEILLRPRRVLQAKEGRKSADDMVVVPIN